MGIGPDSNEEQLNVSEPVAHGEKTPIVSMGGKSEMPSSVAL